MFYKRYKTVNMIKKESKELRIRKFLKEGWWDTKFVSNNSNGYLSEFSSLLNKFWQTKNK